jgi:hypothetical protein
MSPRVRTLLIAAAALLLAIQVIPLDRSNPPVEEEAPAPPQVREILRRACYDCHSNETTWPWYGYVAPTSWLLAYDVSQAREHLNFSTWNRYDAGERRDNLKDAWEEIEDGEMPLFFYVWLHPEASLGDDDLQALRAWAEPGS